ncbi:MAG TPA: ParA family protein [Myxococcota bacterium]|nr:ParA family protein [Myxococcota bacterium]
MPPPAFESASAGSDRPGTGRVLAVSSNKGGVGKTTLATNLAIYLRALHEELPILIFSLDDQGIVERMFGLDTRPPGDANVKHGWAERSFERMIHLGQYGVHYVPSAPDTALLKARADDPNTLRRILERTEWPGLVIIDTKSDLEGLTRNALHAADRVLVPVADWASLEEAGKVLAILERAGFRERARVVLTLVDRRTHVESTGEELAERLRDEVIRRGWPICQASISRSPRVEALNSESVQPLSILHAARGTSVHRELRELAEEVAKDLGLGPGLRVLRSEPPRPPVGSRGAISDFKAALLRGRFRL